MSLYKIILRIERINFILITCLVINYQNKNNNEKKKQKLDVLFSLK